MAASHLPSLSQLLLLMFLSACATSASSNTTSAGLVVGGNSTNATTTTPMIAISYCKLCRDHGQCEQAYRGGPGVFCGATWLRRSACCCATSDRCSRVRIQGDVVACECTPKPNHRSAKNHHIGIFSSNTIAWTGIAMAVLGVLFAMYLYTTRLDRQTHDHYRQARERERRGPQSRATRCDPPRIAVSAPHAPAVTS